MNRVEQQPRRVLIVAYAFAPVAYAGVYRTLKHCKYLGTRGWLPVVLTARPSSSAHQDDALSRQVPPDVRIHRTFDIDPAKWIARRLHRKGKRAAARVGEGGGAAPPQAEAPEVQPPARVGLFGRLKRFAVALLTESPDSHVFWIPFAFLRGCVILLRERIDVIYCSSPPHSAHLVAFALAKCFRLPYVLDFRDPWPVNGSVERPSTTKLDWVLRWETKLKRRIARHAAALITASPGEKHELSAEFPEIEPERIVDITNGYDPDDFAATEARDAPRETLTLTHAGTIYDGSAGEFFAALRAVTHTPAEVRPAIRVQLVGEIAGEYTTVVHELEAQGTVQRYPLQPHRAALRMMMESDVLVILLGGKRFLASEIPSKVFEYLHAGKPILAIVRDGDLAQILRRSGLGIVVSPDSAEELAGILQGLCRDHAAGRLTKMPDRAYIRTFERAALTEQLATILDTACRQPARRLI